MITAKDEALEGLKTAQRALDKPLDTMSLFLLRATLAFVKERVELLTVARPRPSRKAAAGSTAADDDEHEDDEGRHTA